MAAERDPRMPPPYDADEGLRDWGSNIPCPQYDDDDYAGHRFEQSLYAGLEMAQHGPQSNQERRKRRHKHRKREPETSSKRSPHAPPSTPPSERVQFLLGTNADDDDEERATHDIFCEMSELLQNSNDPDDWQWKEVARWVKFEEDVEEGGERWSKPFVATLSLYSLLEVRKCLMSGSVLLDCNADGIDKVAELIIENMVNSKVLKEEDRDRVIEIILRRHRHLYEKKRGEGSVRGLAIVRSLADIGRKKSEPNSMGHRLSLSANNNHQRPSLFSRKFSTPDGFMSRVHHTHGEPHSSHSEKNSPKGSHHAIPSSSDVLRLNAIHANALKRDETAPALMPKTDSFPRVESCMDLDNEKIKKNLAFMKKIPPDSEAANILVGEAAFLEKPVTGFVRLSKAVMMGDLTEVPVPTRFVFILLGPITETSKKKYHEIGRSIATLMSDEIYHDVAYKARNKMDLLSGVDEFLSNCTVLPPGEWDPSIRIEPPKSIPSQDGRREGGENVPNGTGAEKKKEETADEHCDSTLVRTGRLFGGLVTDIKRKAPFYVSDFKDALSIQCVASLIFLYFACLTPIITFGGLLGDATEQNMAAMESILAGAICGIVFALFAGQPLTILGSTGPVLVFETITYHFCHDFNIQYLPFRWWIGLWVMFFLVLMVAFDLSALVRFITRFTEESFAALISLIFIKEAFAKLFHIVDSHPFNTDPGFTVDCSCEPPNSTRNETSVLLTTLSTMPDYSNASDKEECLAMKGVLVGADCDYADSVFFFSVCLFFGTFVIATFLKNFKTTRFFPTFIRGIVSDFAVIIAIVSMLVLDLLVGIKTPKLEVPLEFKPTRDDRGWLISPFGRNEWWTCLAAVIPALLAVILIFMDQQITAVIVNRKENKLKKGAGYHLDLLIVGLLIGLCSILGLPWFVAATVLSITHVMSLKKESESAAPGERVQFLGCREQRVTGIMISFMIGLSVLLTFILKFIPMPILYGVFLFMGVSSLKGVQLVARVLIFLMPQKYQPDYAFLRHVPLKRVHFFTAIQVTCLIILWVIKTIKAVSIVFPLMVLAMCFVRKGMDYIFTQHELSWLDDIMPEIHKRQKEDEEKEQESKNKEMSKTLAEGGGNVEIPLSDGNVMTIPVEKITYKPETATLNISEEMAETAVWRQIAANAGKEKQKEEREKRRRKKKKEKPPKTHANVIAEEDEDQGIVINMSPSKREKGKNEEMQSLMTPNIVVDPPSNDTSPV